MRFEGRLHHFNFLCMLNWKIGPNGGMMTTPLFPIPLCTITPGNYSGRYRILCHGLFLRHGVLLSWPIPWVWLKSTPKHNQTGQVLIAAWLLACVGILCKQRINQCFGLVPFACWWDTEIASLSLLIKNTSPDSKSWSDFLSPPNFPTSLLFFFSILLSLSLYPLRCYKSSQQSTPSASGLTWSGGFLLHLAKLLRWFSEDSQHSASKGKTENEQLTCCSHAAYCSLNALLFAWLRALFLWKQRLSV